MVSDHHGGEDIVEHRSWLHCGQEANRDNALLAAFLLLLLSFHPGPASRTVVMTARVGLSSPS
jgi:hypothetical protein